MIAYPNAKINLGLNVVRKRTDGFHDLETIFYPIPLRDILEIIPNQENRIRFSSSGIEIPSSKGGNLVEKAVHLIKQDFDVPFVDVHLHKQIPIGAGLGGGSADAAFALKLLNELFELKISVQQLESYAGHLGSDCPFFIKNQPVFAQGKGDEFTAIDFSLKDKYLVLIYPAIHVSTALAYSGVAPELSLHDLQAAIQQPMLTWKNTVKNDFEASVFVKFPLLKELKEMLYDKGAFYACMSGSGSSIVGVFNEKPAIQLADHFSSWILKLD